MAGVEEFMHLDENVESQDLSKFPDLKCVIISGHEHDVEILDLTDLTHLSVELDAEKYKFKILDSVVGRLTDLKLFSDVKFPLDKLRNIRELEANGINVDLDVTDLKLTSLNLRRCTGAVKNLGSAASSGLKTLDLMHFGGVVKHVKCDWKLETLNIDVDGKIPYLCSTIKQLGLFMKRKCLVPVSELPDLERLDVHGDFDGKLNLSKNKKLTGLVLSGDFDDSLDLDLTENPELKSVLLTSGMRNLPKFLSKNKIGQLWMMGAFDKQIDPAMFPELQQLKLGPKYTQSLGYYPKLTHLDIEFGDTKTKPEIDFTKYKKLRYLKLENYKGKLNIGKCRKLESLILFGFSGSLDVTKNAKLSKLVIIKSDIKKLDLTKNPELANMQTDLPDSVLVLPRE